jgi:hypothetical protein
MSAATKKSVAAVATILASALFLYAWFVGSGPSFDLAEHKALGEAVAEEALKLAGPNGHITLFARDTQTYRNPAADAQLAGFQRAMKKSSARLGPMRLLKQNPVRVVSLPPGEFFDIARKDPNTVIVSLIGPPVLDDARLAKLGEKRPKTVALCSGSLPRQIDLRRLFQQELLTVAIVSRTGAVPGSSSATARNRFDSLYAIVTSANLSDLPLVARANP